MIMHWFFSFSSTACIMINDILHRCWMTSRSQAESADSGPQCRRSSDCYRVPLYPRNPLVEKWFPCFFFQWFIMMFSNHGHVSFFLNPIFRYTVHPYSFWRQRVLQPISCDVRHVPAEGVLSFMASVKLKDLCCAQWWKLPLKEDQKGLLQAICR